MISRLTVNWLNRLTADMTKEEIGEMKFQKVMQIVLAGIRSVRHTVGETHEGMHEVITQQIASEITKQPKEAVQQTVSTVLTEMLDQNWDRSDIGNRHWKGKDLEKVSQKLGIRPSDDVIIVMGELLERQSENVGEKLKTTIREKLELPHVTAVSCIPRVFQNTAVMLKKFTDSIDIRLHHFWVFLHVSAVDNYSHTHAFIKFISPSSAHTALYQIYASKAHVCYALCLRELIMECWIFFFFMCCHHWSDRFDSFF